MVSRFFAGFRDASRGLGYLFREEPHFRFQIVFAIFLALALVFLRLTYAEAGFIIVAIVIVVGSEAANTVIEQIMDSVSMERKRWIGSIKDMMASVVLINSIGAFCIGAITLVHYMMRVMGVTYMGDLDMAILYRLNAFAGQTALGDWVIIFFASILPYVLVFVFLSVIGIARISVRQKMYRIIAGGMSGLVARFGLTELIRFLHPRLPPFMVDHVHQLIAEQGNSFPSGHAAFFFALSGAVFYWNKPLGICFFAASVLMGIARVAAGVHYPSDIVAGMIVGIASTWIVMRVMSRFEKRFSY